MEMQIHLDQSANFNLLPLNVSVKTGHSKNRSKSHEMQQIETNT